MGNSVYGVHLRLAINGNPQNTLSFLIFFDTMRCSKTSTAALPGDKSLATTGPILCMGIVFAELFSLI